MGTKKRVFVDPESKYQPVAEPEVLFDHLTDGNMFIHPSGTHMSHACCDCGSSHNIRLTVINAEELEVQYFKNHNLTRLTRAAGVNGVLVSPVFYKTLLTMADAMAQWPKGDFLSPKEHKTLRRKARKLAKQVVVEQTRFAKEVQSGNFLS